MENMMDSNRRNFFRNFGNKTATATISVMMPSMVQAVEHSSDFEKYSSQIDLKINNLADEYSEKMNKAKADLARQIRLINLRLHASDLYITNQQFQLHIIFLLLLASFAIDGGMSLTWLFLQ